LAFQLFMNMKMMSMLLTLLLTCAAIFILHLNTHVSLVFSSPNACLITTSVSVVRFTHSLVHTHSQIHCTIASGHIHDSK
jgi:hypothetical protein